MDCYPMAAVERMMKIQEVILRAMVKKITWWQAAEISGIIDRQMRRSYWRYKEFGYDGLPLASRMTETGLPLAIGQAPDRRFLICIFRHRNMVAGAPSCHVF